MKDLVRIADLTRGDVGQLLGLAREFAEDPSGDPGLLRGRSVALYLPRHSVHTRIATVSAVAALGGVAVPLGPKDLDIGTGAEAIEETAEVLGELTGAFLLGALPDENVRRFAAATAVPVVNAYSDLHHPLQGLSDFLALRQVFGDSFGQHGERIAYVGGRSNVLHSLLETAAVLGVDVTVATPPGYGPDHDVLPEIKEIAMDTGARITLTGDAEEAVTGATAVYADVWPFESDRPSHPQQARERALASYRVDSRMLALAAPQAVFMHCLPAREQTRAVDRSAVRPSIARRQVACRRPVVQAVLRVLFTTGLDERI